MDVEAPRPRVALVPAEGRCGGGERPWRYLVGLIFTRVGPTGRAALRACSGVGGMLPPLRVRRARRQYELRSGASTPWPTARRSQHSLVSRGVTPEELAGMPSHCGEPVGLSPELTTRRAGADERASDEHQTRARPPPLSVPDPRDPRPIDDAGAPVATLELRDGQASAARRSRSPAEARPSRRTRRRPDRHRPIGLPGLLREVQRGTPTSRRRSALRGREPAALRRRRQVNDWADIDVKRGVAIAARPGHVPPGRIKAAVALRVAAAAPGPGGGESHARPALLRPGARRRRRRGLRRGAGGVDHEEERRHLRVPRPRLRARPAGVRGPAPRADAGHRAGRPPHAGVRTLQEGRRA